jgi:hypothetical protein
MVTTANVNWIDQIEHDAKRSLPESLRSIVASRLITSPTARAVAEIAVKPLIFRRNWSEVGGWNEASVLTR